MWWRRAPRDEEFKQEIDAHLALDTDRFISDGMSPDQGKHAARRAFGNVTRVKERFYESRRVMWLDDLARDVRYGLRQLRRHPGFAVVAIGSVALGIAATAAVFAFLDALVLHPLPYVGADRMVTMSQVTKQGEGRGGVPLSGQEFAEFQQQDLFDGVIATAGWVMTMTGSDLPERVLAGQVSGDAFRYFGLAPVLGRALSPADVPLTGEPRAVAVLSYRFWRGRFGGDTHIVGEDIRLDGQPYTIVGVASSRFHYLNADVYLPLRRAFDAQNRFGVEARLRPGVTLERAEAALQPWFSRLATASPGRFLPDVHLQLLRVIPRRTRPFRDTFTLLFGAATVLLAVGCANLAILLLARGATRQRELAVRKAVGASRRRIMAQLLVESLLLAAIGGLIGISAAWWGIPAVVRWLPPSFLPDDIVIDVTASVVVFSAGVTLFTGVLFGLSPALQASRPGVIHAMQPNVIAESTVHRTRAHAVLIAGQVALTLLLLVGAAAALRTFVELTRMPLGFNPRHLLVTNVPLPEGTYTTWEARATFLDRVRAQVAATPGIESAAFFFGRPADLPPATPPLMPLERMDRPGENYQPASVQQISPSFFSTLQIPLVSGRLWSEAEHANGTHVAVVNRRTAAQLWPEGNIIGQRVRLRQMTARESWQVAAPHSNDPLEIIGVVGDTPNRGLHGQSWLSVYVPMTLVMGDMPSLVVRTRGEPLAMVRTVQEQVHAISPSQVIAGTTTGDDVLRRAGWGREEIVASLFLVFALSALLLASVGLYSVVSYVVSQRMREFGIRRALGARHGDLVWRAVRPTLITVAAGAGLGIVLSVALDRLAVQWTHVNTRDPLMIGVVTCVIFVVAFVATLFPAARAARIDPLVAIRCE